MGRVNNQLPSNLPQLQNLIKRDPDSYNDEFQQQYRHYQSLCEVFKLKPEQHKKELADLVMFITQVSHCYREQLKHFSEEIQDILEKHYAIMNPDVRMTFCKSLILLRRKNLMSAASLLKFFFKLLNCQDRALRKMVYNHIIQDIRDVNSKHKDVTVNTQLQNFLYNVLRTSSNQTAAKLALDVLVDLYRRQVWNDARTVNVIALEGCFSEYTKVLVAALTFFLGRDQVADQVEEDSDAEDAGDAGGTPSSRSVKDIAMAHRVAKKTRKRQKQMQRALAALKRHKKKQKPASFNYSALNLLHDPQDLAEKLFKSLESSRERFEVRLLVMNLVSRLVGLHGLVLINFYPYIQRFLQPHQREITKMLTFAAQAAHAEVPPDAVEPVLRTIANNFVSERNSRECMTVGLNAIRELCSRCPLVMTEDLLHDLAQYRQYRDKNVSMAAKSLISLYRFTYPELLHKKFRGRPTEYTAELKREEFGQLTSKDFIPGAEILASTDGKEADGKETDGKETEGKETDSKETHGEDADEWESASEDSEDSDGGWEDVEHSDEGENDDPNDAAPPVKATAEDAASKAAAAKEVSTMRVFSQEDLKRLKVHQVKKELQITKSRFDKEKDKKRKFEESMISIDSSDEEGEENTGLVKLSKIEKFYKRAKLQKPETKDEAQKKKFERKEKRTKTQKGNTNKEKLRNKAFMMVKQKVKKKSSRSFKDKQVALRNALLKRQKSYKFKN